MSNQLDLFGQTQPKAPRAGAPPVGPAPIAPEIAALASARPAGLFLGTSSWYFPGWAGIVWDRAVPESVLSRHGLAAYAQHPLFNCVGLDRTFYRPLARADYAAYAAQVPAGFRFLVKAPAACTDALIRDASGRGVQPNPQFLDADYAVREFVLPCSEGLGDKAGPLTFQFSPLARSQLREPRAFAQALREFLARLPRGPLYAVEVRNPELLSDELRQVLHESGTRWCYGVHARLPDPAAQARWLGEDGGPLVVRWSLHAGHAYEGAKALYDPFDRLVEPDPSTRAQLARLAAEALTAGRETIITVNNKAEGSAPLSIYSLARAILDELERLKGRE